MKEIQSVCQTKWTTSPKSNRKWPSWAELLFWAPPLHCMLPAKSLVAQESKKRPNVTCQQYRCQVLSLISMEWSLKARMWFLGLGRPWYSCWRHQSKLKGAFHLPFCRMAVARPRRQRLIRWISSLNSQMVSWALHRCWPKRRSFFARPYSRDRSSRNASEISGSWSMAMLRMTSKCFSATDFKRWSRWWNWWVWKRQPVHLCLLITRRAGIVNLRCWQWGTRCLSDMAWQWKSWGRSSSSVQSSPPATHTRSSLSCRSPATSSALKMVACMASRWALMILKLLQSSRLTTTSYFPTIIHHLATALACSS